MRILYIFPHPDDESFGPAPVLDQQRRNGHEVHLLTLTRGGATKVRHDFGYSVEEMGDIRYDEMKCVEKVLDLSSMTVWDFPDSGLKEVDPTVLVDAISTYVRDLDPDVLVTYPVHGISGFHDHLVSHAVVKHVYCTLQEREATSVRRLAFFTIAEGSQPEGGPDLHTSTEEEIDCQIQPDREAGEKGRKALNCYESYQRVIKETRVMESVHDKKYFEFFQEDFDPRVSSLTAGL